MFGLRAEKKVVEYSFTRINANCNEFTRIFGGGLERIAINIWERVCEDFNELTRNLERSWKDGHELMQMEI